MLCRRLLIPAAVLSMVLATALGTYAGFGRHVHLVTHRR